MDSIDFLPDRIKDQRARRHRLMRRLYLLGLCLAGLAALGWSRNARIRHAEAELSLVNGRSANIQRQLSILGLLQNQQAQLLLKKRIDETLGSRVGMLVLLSELERLMPHSVTLTSLKIGTKDLACAIVAPGGGKNRSVRAEAAAATGHHKTPKHVVKRVQVVLTGLAPTDVDVANFIGQLSASRLFENVTMGYAKNVVFRGRSAREFQARCYVAR